MGEREKEVGTVKVATSSGETGGFISRQCFPVILEG